MLSYSDLILHQIICMFLLAPLKLYYILSYYFGLQIKRWLQYILHLKSIKGRLHLMPMLLKSQLFQLIYLCFLIPILCLVLAEVLPEGFVSMTFVLQYYFKCLLVYISFILFFFSYNDSFLNICYSFAMTINNVFSFINFWMPWGILINKKICVWNWAGLANPAFLIPYVNYIIIWAKQNLYITL